MLSFFPRIRGVRAGVVMQTLLMMTETQHDGLRALKSPIHYYGSDPYDTFRITRALMRWGRSDLSQAILTRQLGRRCAQVGATSNPLSSPWPVAQSTLLLSWLLLMYAYTRGNAQGHGTWEMWEIDGKDDCGRDNVTPLFIVQGLASNALTDQWRFMPAGSTAAREWLDKIWPALDGTANATQGQRELCGEACAGLLPDSGVRFERCFNR